MLVFKNKTAVILIMSSTIAKVEAIEERKSFKIRVAAKCVRSGFKDALLM
ncbi:hypothetical protein [Chamaesiphon sp. VAR_48_metabat_403]|nr:hypothetical protein [Chamaesiphon sp. VAR_48_metabat_403]